MCLAVESVEKSPNAHQTMISFSLLCKLPLVIATFKNLHEYNYTSDMCRHLGSSWGNHEATACPLKVKNVFKHGEITSEVIRLMTSLDRECGSCGRYDMYVLCHVSKFVNW